MEITPDQLEALKKSLYEEMKSKIVEDLKSEEDKRREALLKERETAKQNREAYVTAMKESTDPWVDILGIVQTNEGVKVELDWNDAFVKYLRAEGIAAAKDEAVVQKWVALLLRDMSETMEGAGPVTRSESEYA
jgi:protease II